jgi:hypothetical protein
MQSYAESLSATDRFLSLAVRGQRSELERAELTALLSRIGTEQIITAARQNQVLPLVAVAVCGTLPANRLTAEWEEIYQANERRVTGLMDGLTRVVSRLEAQGCQSAVIENGGVLFGTQLPLTAFCAGDFDLLVSGADWAKVNAAFQAEQFAPMDRRGRPTNRVEFSRRLPDGETQWLGAGYAPFDRMWVPLSYVDRTAVWLSQRIPSTKSDRIWVLSPADALGLVAIHTSLHSYVRAPGIRLHVDVDRLVRDTNIDWDSFVAEVRATGLCTRAFVSLIMAHGLLATPVPDWVLTALYPGDWRWRQISRLLSREGTFANGQRKLIAGKAVWLDMLLEDKGPAHWFRMVVLPPDDWMHEHFERDTDQQSKMVLSLHLKRWSAAFGRWSPQ